MRLNVFEGRLSFRRPFYFTNRLPGRLLLFATLAYLETTATHIYLSPYLALAGWLSGPASIRGFGMLFYALGKLFAYRFSVVFIALAFILISRFRGIVKDSAPIPFGRWWFGAHIVLFGACLFVRQQFVSAPGKGAVSGSTLLICLWISAGYTVCLAFACVPPSAWLRLARTSYPVWAYALAFACAVVLAGVALQQSWESSASVPGLMLQRGTFLAAHSLLHWLIPGTTVNPAHYSIGAPHFQVEIREGCSGVEGLALMLAFSAVWLWLRRKELCIPRALALVPVALAGAFALNIARICLLVWIGNSIDENVAVFGFHSQAGWMAFTALAIAFAFTLERLAWVQNDAAASLPAAAPPLSTVSPRETVESPLAIAYLTPFLAILAAGFVSRSISGSFEWSYPLRFFAAGFMLWRYRVPLRRLDWRAGWVAVFAGAAVFAIWIAPGIFLSTAPPSALAGGLASLPGTSRIAWLAFRVTAAVTTVPVAEELAFRGYLARRLIARDFDAVPFRALRLLPIAVSSVGFGIMHGRAWPVGIIAGLAFAFILRRRGRMGDAVAAHAVSNLLLAAWVLVRGDYAQW